MTATFAQLLNIRARSESTSEDLGSLEQIGSPGGDKAVVMVYNDSPEIMRVAFAGGPEPRVEEIAACPGCPLGVQGQPSVCSRQAVLKRIVLAPGEYDFASDHPKNSGIIPSHAHWSLKPGKQYFACMGIFKPQ
jgi:hypothetical protein